MRFFKYILCSLRMTSHNFLFGIVLWRNRSKFCILCIYNLQWIGLNYARFLLGDFPRLRQHYLIFNVWYDNHSSADLTSTGSPKRLIKNYRPSTTSLDYSRRHAQNPNQVDPRDRENEADHPVRLFGFKRIGTVFPPSLTKGSSTFLPEHRFLTMPHKKQVKNRNTFVTLERVGWGETKSTN